MVPTAMPTTSATVWYAMPSRPTSRITLRCSSGSKARARSRSRNSSRRSWLAARVNEGSVSLTSTSEPWRTVRRTELTYWLCMRVKSQARRSVPSAQRCCLASPRGKEPAGLSLVRGHYQAHPETVRVVPNDGVSGQSVYRAGELAGCGAAALIDQSPDRPIALATRRASLRVSNCMAWSSSPQRGGSGEISHTGSLSRCCLITYMARPGVLFGSCTAIAKSSPTVGVMARAKEPTANSFVRAVKEGGLMNSLRKPRAQGQ
jgi:hypothetical protein